MSSTETKRVIVITGATGFIGRAVVRKLLKHDFLIHAVVRSPEKARALFGNPNNLKIFVGSLLDEKFLRSACAGAAGIVHLAGAKNDEPESRTTNVTGSETIVRAARAENLNWLLNISTQSVKIAGPGLYAQTKLAAEKIMHASGLPTTTLRLSLVYGDEPTGVSRLVASAARWPIFPMVGSGLARFRPIHADDVAECIYQCIIKNIFTNEQYDVGGPDELTFNEYVKFLSIQKTGRPPRIIHLPDWFWFLAARISKKLFDHPPITVSNVLGASSVVSMDTAPLQKLISLTPRSLYTEQDQTPAEQEARALLQYGFTSLGIKTALDKNIISIFLNACTKLNCPAPLFKPNVLRRPWLLELLDSGSAAWGKTSLIRKKFFITAAIVECSPPSAPKLLPKKSSVLNLILRSFWYGLQAGIKTVVGTGFWLLRKNFTTYGK